MKWKMADTNKLLHCLAGLQRTGSIQLHTVAIKGDRIPHTVFIELLTLSATCGQVNNRPYKTTPTMRPRKDNQQRLTLVKDVKRATENYITVPQEYVVNGRMHLVDTPQE